MSGIADNLRAIKAAYYAWENASDSEKPVKMNLLRFAMARLPDPDAVGLYMKESQRCIRQLEDMHHLWKDFGGDDGQGHFEGEYIIGSMVGRANAAIAKLEEQ